jgi:DNA polymerase-3 subunit beta
MKFECSRDALARAVALPAAIAPARSTKESFQSLRLTAEKGRMSIEATDGDLWARSVETAVETTRPGSVALSSSLFETIVRNVEGRTIQLEAQGRFCEIRSEDAQYNLVVLDSGDSSLEPPEVAPLFRIERGQLESLLARLVLAVGQDVGRYAVNGLLVEYTGTTLTVVATDSRRMSRATRIVTPVGDDRAGRRAIVPVKAMQEALRAAAATDSIDIGFNDEFCTIRTDSILVSTRLIVGDFPDHRRIIPEALPHSFVVAREPLLSGIRKTAVFAQEPVRSVRFELADGILTLKAEAEGRGRSTTRIPTESKTSQNIVIDLNPDFLLEHVKTLDSANVRIEYRDDQSAVLVRQDADQDVYLVMPITTN